MSNVTHLPKVTPAALSSCDDDPDFIFKDVKDELLEPEEPPTQAEVNQQLAQIITMQNRTIAELMKEIAELMGQVSGLDSRLRILEGRPE